MKRKTLAGVPLRSDGTLPLLSGAQDLGEMLKSLEDEYKKLVQAKERGETVDEAKMTELKSELDQIKALVEKHQPEPTPKEDPTAAPASFDTEAFSKNLADALKGTFAPASAPEPEPTLEPAPEPKAAPAAPTFDAASFTDVITQSVQKAFEDVRLPGTAVLPGAKDATLEQIAKLAESKGLTIVDPQGLRVLEDVDVKAFVTSDKPQFAKMFGMLYRKKEGLLEEFDRRALKAMARGTDASGGYLVPQQWMDDILGLIRAQAIVRMAGPRIIPFAKSMMQTSVSGGASANYIGENSAITPSEMTFAEAPLLSPKILAGLIPVSNDLIGDAPEVEQLVRDELATVIALKEDISFIEGSGAANIPRGFKNMVGITDMTTSLAIPANGGPFLADYIRQMVGRLRTMNVRGARLAFFFHPAVLTQLETQKDNDGRYFLENGVIKYNGNGESGAIWGIPFYTSTQIPVNLTRGIATTATYILLVNMAEALLGINRELVLDSSNEASYTPDGGATWISAFQNRQTLYRAQMAHDINHRRKDQIILLQGVVV